MDDAELLHLYEHGYVIFRQIVPLEMCAAAKRIADEAQGAAAFGGDDPALLDLFRKTPLMQKALSALGPNITGWAQPKNPKGRGDGASNGEEVISDQAPRSCQIAKVGVSGPPSDRIGGNGFRQSDLPIYEPSGGPFHAHMDGVKAHSHPPLLVISGAFFLTDCLWLRRSGAAAPHRCSPGTKTPQIGTTVRPETAAPAQTIHTLPART